MIEFYTVTEPPTGDEVSNMASEAFLRDESLRLTVLSQQEVPRPEPKEISLSVFRMTRLVGRVVFNGKLEGSDSSATITIDEDSPSQPVKVSLVYPS